MNENINYAIMHSLKEEEHMGIVVFGAVFVDIKGYPLAQYIPGGRNVGRVVQVHGGVSRNVAEDIANVELRPVFVSVVDDSGTGKDVIAKLKKHKVNTDYITVSRDGLGTWLAIFNNDGDVIASISRRPDLSRIKTVLDEHGDEIIGNADSVVVEIDMDPSLLQQIFDLAEKYGKSTVQVILRWHTRMGFAVIPGSRNVDHIRDNLDILDFTLTDDDMAAIAQLDRGVRYYHRTDEQLVQFAAWKPDFEKA